MSSFVHPRVSELRSSALIEDGSRILCHRASPKMAWRRQSGGTVEGFGSDERMPRCWGHQLSTTEPANAWNSAFDQYSALVIMMEIKLGKSDDCSWISTAADQYSDLNVEELTQPDIVKDYLSCTGKADQSRKNEVETKWQEIVSARRDWVDESLRGWEQGDQVYCD